MAKPNTLDDLLDLLPGLRKCRSLNADWLRRLLDRRAKQCSWCGGKVPRGCSKWCSEACVAAFRARCWPQTQASLVMDRDQGICQRCGRDIKASRREFEAAWELYLKQHNPPMGKAYWKTMEELKERHGFSRGQWQEVDHIVPVMDGGGLMGIDNLRLLCGSCHAKATRRLAGQRAKRKAR